MCLQLPNQITYLDTFGVRTWQLAPTLLGRIAVKKKKDPLLIFWVLLVGSPPFPVPGTRMTAHRPAKCRNLGPYMRSGIVDTERVTSEPGKFGLGLILLNVSESLTCYMNFAAQDGFFEGFCIITSI